MQLLSFKAILLGGLLSIAVSFLLSVILGVSIASGVRETNLAPAASHEATLTAMRQAKWVYLAFALMASLLGGYVAARIAKRKELWHGACSSVLSLAVGVTTMVRGASFYPLWTQFLIMVFTIICSGLGGYLWLVQQKKWGRKPLNSRS